MTTKEERFLQELVQFYRNRGITSAHAKQFSARLNGKVVNLSELYSLVLEYGGSYKVNQCNLWEEIYCRLFQTSHIGANFAVALRQTYNRYLLQYEKIVSGSFPAEPWNEEEDYENLYFSNNHQSNSLHHNKRDLNTVTDSKGEVHNDTKLYCSLLSGLPNELNFAFDVATILSNCNRFDWNSDYKFVNVLLESMRSYCCICDQIEEDLAFGRMVFTEEDEVSLFEKYLQSSINSSSISPSSTTRTDEQVLENGDSSAEANLPSLPVKKGIDFIERKCNCYRQFWHQLCSDEETLSLIFSDEQTEVDFKLPYVCKDIPLQLLKKVEHRVELVAGILLNISSTYEQHKRNRVSMVPLLKFVALLMRSEKVVYLNLSLDILSNIAPALSFTTRPQLELYYTLVQFTLRNIVHIAMCSDNLHNITKSFEILARYVACINNETNHFLENLFESVQLYERITQLLTCQFDVSLLLALLEFCFTLSEVRPSLLVQSESKVLVKILVSLLNCETSQHFTTGALKKVKLIDERPRNEVTDENRKNCQNGGQVLKTNTINSPLAQNILDNESFAINWLRNTYDDAPGMSFKVNDIYAEYVKYCCRNSRKNVIAAQSFSFLIKRCFPSCNLNSNKTIVDGLALKNCLIVNASEATKQAVNNGLQQHPQLMSPILKAHLSTPPRNNVIAGDGTPTSSTTNTSTLIKSLLASKLRNNQQAGCVTPPPSPLIKPIVTQVSTPVANSLTPNATIFTGDAANTVKSVEMNTPKNVVLTNNPSTTFALTPTSTINMTNNIIVPAGSTMQPPTPQQILVVRTIITGPGQQNAGSPVRLLVPASVLAQQRMPTSTVSASNVNGLVSIVGTSNQNSVVQTVSSPTTVIQNQPPPPPAVVAGPVSSVASNITNSSITVSSTVSTSTVPAPIRNSVANNSPLLNVLLDKGKLPEFSTQPNPVMCVAPPTVVANSVAVNSVASSTVPSTGQQTSTNIVSNPNGTAPTNVTVTTAQSQSNVSNEVVQPVLNHNANSIANAKDTGTDAAKISASGATTFLVNGDIKPNTATQVITNCVTNESTVKHQLENCTNSLDANKRLKSGSGCENGTGSSVNNETTPTIIEKQTTVNGGNASISNHVAGEQTSATNRVVVGNNNEQTSESSSTTTSAVVVNSNDSKPVVTSTVADSTNSTSTVASPVISNVQLVPPKPPVPVAEYECQWAGCKMKFVRTSEVFYHVHMAHIMGPSCPNITSCLWGGPEGKGPGCLSKRPKLSLLTHLQDFHCNSTVLKQEVMRKRQLLAIGATTIVLPQPPPHPGYAADAAMMAIQRQSVRPENLPAPAQPNPLTVSIRLTSALILRNLAERSHHIKRSLGLFEPQLCEISLAEGRDESRTIAQCLAVINDVK